MTHGRLAVAVVGLSLLSVSCELQERGPETASRLDTVRAQPSASEPEGDRDPVFAPADEAELVVGDDFWAGTGTVAYELVGEFRSIEAMRSSLDLTLEVAPSGDRIWRLEDILVTIDFRGPGPTAVWRVAGPVDVVEPYVRRLQEESSDRSPLRELGVLPLDVGYCCEGPGSSPP